MKNFLVIGVAVILLLLTIAYWYWLGRSSTKRLWRELKTADYDDSVTVLKQVRKRAVLLSWAVYLINPLAFIIFAWGMYFGFNANKIRLILIQNDTVVTKIALLMFIYVLFMTLVTLIISNGMRKDLEDTFKHFDSAVVESDGTEEDDVAVDGEATGDVVGDHEVAEEVAPAGVNKRKPRRRVVHRGQAQVTPVEHEEDVYEDAGDQVPDKPNIDVADEEPNADRVAPEDRVAVPKPRVAKKRVPVKPVISDVVVDDDDDAGDDGEVVDPVSNVDDPYAVDADDDPDVGSDADSGVAPDDDVTEDTDGGTEDFVDDEDAGYPQGGAEYPDNEEAEAPTGADSLSQRLHGTAVNHHAVNTPEDALREHQREQVIRGSDRVNRGKRVRRPNYTNESGLNNDDGSLSSRLHQGNYQAKPKPQADQAVAGDRGGHVKRNRHVRETPNKDVPVEQSDLLLEILGYGDKK